MPAQGIKKPSLPCFKGRKTNFSAVPPTFGAQNAAPFYGTGSPMPDPCNGRSPWQPTCPFQPPRSGGNFMPQQPAPASSPGGHSLQSQRCRTTSSVIAVFQIRLYYTEPGAKCQAENQQATEIHFALASPSAQEQRWFPAAGQPPRRAAGIPLRRLHRK